MSKRCVNKRTDLHECVLEPVLVRLVGEPVGDDSMTLVFPQREQDLDVGANVGVDHQNALERSIP